MNAAYDAVAIVRAASVADAWADDIAARQLERHQRQWVKRYRALSTAAGRRKPVLAPDTKELALAA